MALAPVFAADNAPVKSLAALVSVIAPAPVLKLAMPAAAACLIAPVWVMVFAPVAVTVSVPVPTVDAPITMAFLSVMATLFAPLLFRLTAPVKSLVTVARVITPAPALKADVPPTVRPPAFWVMPTALTVRLLAVLIVPS